MYTLNENVLLLQISIPELKIYMDRIQASMNLFFRDVKNHTAILM